MSFSQDDLKEPSETSSVRRILPFSVLRAASEKLDLLGVESTGIERVDLLHREKKHTRQLITVMGLWVLACGGLSSMSSFYLGPMVYGLGLKKTFLLGFFAQALGCAVAAYCSLMGPRSGCRQMVGARFLFGWWLAKFICLVNVVGVCGWSIVNCIVGGQILSAMSNGGIPLIVAIVIIAVVSLVILVGGIRYLLRVESLLSIPVNFAFLMLYIVSSKQFAHLLSRDATMLLLQLRGSELSFFSLCFSITSTWGGIASDYYTLFPEDTPDAEVFALTFFGTLLPTTFVGGAAILTGNVAMNYAPWGEAYEKLGMGGLLNEAFKPWGGGGKFLLVLIFLSLMSNNILNTYSGAFSVQLMLVWFSKIPRWLWSIGFTAVYLVCAIVGRYKFGTILGNFLPMVGYWVAMYFVLLLEENSIFRTSRLSHLFTKEAEVENPSETTGSHYNFAIWNDYGRLTHGFAAFCAFLGAVAGAVVGMAQTYWVGPLARKAGGAGGGDIAMWLCMGFPGLIYPPLRYLELRKFGR